MPKLRLKTMCLAAGLAVLLSACATATKPPQAAVAAAPPAVLQPALPKAAHHHRITVSAQPTADELKSLRALGYTHIVNVRTAAEMADPNQVPFDEAVLTAEAGLDYVHLPVGGDAFPYRPEVLDGLAAAIGDGESRVLLHCAGGMRASLVYAGYAVKYLGVDPDVALRGTAPFGLWPLALEKLSGVPLKVVRADAAAE